ncbi:hypothetical protein [Psychroserpens burtonensis]|uniref:hypothetical protein n=1 Tax=Psychroserpens burtonensis TaxID=49278 RepID=UPI0012F788FA|nr:hypothetical protein [Psychroserpens burtonensis]
MISNKIGVKKLNDEFDEICLAHEKLKYPELDKITQLEIMETGNLKPIAELVPEYKDKGTPTKLLKNYITITKTEFRNYLIETGFIEKQKIENADNPEQDGIWLLKDKIIDQERGHIHRTWNIGNINEASEIYVNLLWEKLNTN